MLTPRAQQEAVYKIVYKGRKTTSARPVLLSQGPFRVFVCVSSLKLLPGLNLCVQCFFFKNIFPPLSRYDPFPSWQCKCKCFVRLHGLYMRNEL